MHLTAKEEVKMSLFTDNVILYVENPNQKTTTNKVQQGCKIEDQYEKPTVFLHTKKQ